MFAIGPYAVAGWAVDLTGSTLKSFIEPDLDTAHPRISPRQRNHARQKQSVSSTLRAKVGFVPTRVCHCGRCGTRWCSPPRAWRWARCFGSASSRRRLLRSYWPRPGASRVPALSGPVGGLQQRRNRTNDRGNPAAHNLKSFAVNVVARAPLLWPRKRMFDCLT